MEYILLITILVLAVLVSSDRTPIFIACFFLPLVSSLICSSRTLFAVNSDDLIRYYQTYMSLGDGYFNLMTMDSEPVFYILNVIIHIFFGELTPRSLLFIYSLITNVLMATAIYRLVDEKIAGVAVFCVLLSTPYLFTTGQLIRQSLSLGFFVWYLSIPIPNLKIRRIVLLISVLTHYVTIFIYLIYLIVTKLKLKNSIYMYMALLSIPLAIIFGSIVSEWFFSVLSILDFGIFSKKVFYYIEGNGAENLGGGIGFTRIIYALFIIMPSYILIKKQENLNITPLLNLLLIIISMTFIFSLVDSFSRRLFVYYSLLAPMFFCIGLNELKLSSFAYKFITCLFFICLFIISITSAPNEFSLFKGVLSFQ